MARTEIRVSGFGGQGVILCGYLIGKSAALKAGKQATLNQSFGPEARGSACSAQVIVSDEKILYPYLTQPDILICMSQEAYAKFEPELKKDGLLLVDEDLVKDAKSRDKIKLYKIPATRFAEEIGRKIVLNIVMLGFFTAVSGLLDKEAVRSTVETSVPKGTEELNLKAFEKGFAYGSELLKSAPTAGKKKKAAVPA
ncbi:pyruvate ferredoxin oxidoreductase [candidate division KSB1 bacterium 4484_87]|nr:MAG: pyruvate ferredoxin oxidoreductase [candidate division KSB1 bacterium 4484_87]